MLLPLIKVCSVFNTTDHTSFFIFFHILWGLQRISNVSIPNLQINWHTINIKRSTINCTQFAFLSSVQDFIKQLQEAGGSDPQSIIGQFGVGFYSAFMVAEKLEVYTRSRLPGSVGYCWTSDGWVNLFCLSIYFVLFLFLHQSCGDTDSPLIVFLVS